VTGPSSATPISRPALNPSDPNSMTRRRGSTIHKGRRIGVDVYVPSAEMMRHQSIVDGLLQPDKDSCRSIQVFGREVSEHAGLPRQDARGILIAAGWRGWGCEEQHICRLSGVPTVGYSTPVQPARITHRPAPRACSIRPGNDPSAELTYGIMCRPVRTFLILRSRTNSPGQPELADAHRCPAACLWRTLVRSRKYPRPLNQLPRLNTARMIGPRTPDDPPFAQGYRRSK